MSELVVQTQRSGNDTNAWQFSLKSLILMTAFVAVCAGLFRLFVPLGVFFLVFSTPALLRTRKYAVGRYAASQSLGMMAIALLSGSLHLLRVRSRRF